MTEDEYVSRIRGLDRAGLLTLWDEIEQGSTAGWPRGKAFELLTLRAFELEGAGICWPYPVRVSGERVEQIDGVAYAMGLSCLVESKHYRRATNVGPITKLKSQLMRRPAATIGILFSYKGFTEPARILAQFIAPQTVLLWEGSEIKYALTNNKMVWTLYQKYRHAVEHGLPDYNVLEGLI